MARLHILFMVMWSCMILHVTLGMRGNHNGGSNNGGNNNGTPDDVEEVECEVECESTGLARA